MRRINKGLKDIIQISEQEKDDLSIGLRQSGFTVCRCRTESDVCIGHGADPSSIVITGDSDLFIYSNIGTIIRPLPKKRRAFVVYEKSEVLQALDLPSPQYLILFGIVSNNDYNGNAQGIGPVRNLRIVKTLKESQRIETMLEEYVSKVEGTDAGDYQAALRVFAYGHQTPVNLPQSTAFQIAIHRLQQAKSKRAEVVRDKRAKQKEE